MLESKQNQSILNILVPRVQTLKVFNMAQIVLHAHVYDAVHLLRYLNIVFSDDRSLKFIASDKECIALH